MAMQKRALSAGVPPDGAPLSPHQSQSVSPNGNVPVCSRQGGSGGVTGGKGAAVLIFMTNRGSKQAGRRRGGGLSV